MCERDWLRSCKFSHRGVIDWACLLPGVIALIGQKSESCRQEIFHFMVIYFRCIRALDSARLCVSLVDFSLNLFFFHQVAEKKSCKKKLLRSLANGRATPSSKLRPDQLLNFMTLTALYLQNCCCFNSPDWRWTMIRAVCDSVHSRWHLHWAEDRHRESADSWAQ